MRKQSVLYRGVSRVLGLLSVLMLAACAESGKMEYVEDYATVDTPTVDYIEQLDVKSSRHQDSFLNQLAMNYRSYAIYNARTSGYPNMGELFAQKAVAAFSGEVPFPETMNNWPIDDEQVAYELSNAYNSMIEQFKNDASENFPELSAELQAKYDCWLSAYSSGQFETADECRARFNKTLDALRDCRNGKRVSPASVIGATDVTESRTQAISVEKSVKIPGSNESGAGTIEAKRSVSAYYPETGNLSAMRRSGASRDGVIVVNNVNVPDNLINPVPVQPMVFNQNIYGGDKTVTNSHNVTNTDESIVAGGTPGCQKTCPEETPDCKVCEEGQDVAEEIVIDADLVSRQEFIDMMTEMRKELAAINARLANLNNGDEEEETTIIKVQQIPLQPKQHVMEEVFEIRFDFNKAVIKPEYEDVIRKLVDATQNNKNIKVSVVGHTDTAGSKNYNYALGGRRADAVQNMLIQYGIPSSQIVAVSAGEEDLKVPTPDGVPNAENRRVRVVKEISYTEPADGRTVPVANVSVEEIEEPCDDEE